jgi:hypothetical protein
MSERVLVSVFVLQETPNMRNINSVQELVDQLVGVLGYSNCLVAGARSCTALYASQQLHTVCTRDTWWMPTAVLLGVSCNAWPTQGSLDYHLDDSIALSVEVLIDVQNPLS